MTTIKETQASIVKWADETFGPAANEDVVMKRMEEEIHEMLETEHLPPLAAALEAADVYITMVRWVQYLGFDLHTLVDEKMAINRARKWRSNNDGTGHHIKDGEK